MQKITDIAAFKAFSLERLDWARQITLKAIDATPDEQLLYRAQGKGNHGAWIMGHLATTDDFVVSAFTGQPNILDESWQKLFAGGSEPLDDVKANPSREELLKAMADTRKRLVDWYQSLDSEALAKPAPDFLQGFIPDAAATPVTTACHECMHLGQFVMTRRIVGLPGVMTG